MLRLHRISSSQLLFSVGRHLANVQLNVELRKFGLVELSDLFLHEITGVVGERLS